MDRVRFVTHQGKQILFIDMTDCVSEDVMVIASEVQRVVTAQPRNSVLTLSDLTGGEFRRDAITRMKVVHHGNLLETRVKITAYNFHDGSFRPSLGLLQTQAYSALVRSRRCHEIRHNRQRKQRRNLVKPVGAVGKRVRYLLSAISKPALN